MSTHYDFIIVGQGLAGSVLAFHLLDTGYKILVIDNEQESTSSKVAGGLYNPVTGKRMVKSWLADELLEYGLPFYKNIEERFNEKIIYPIPLYRIFSSIEEQNHWMAKSASDEYKELIEVDIDYRKQPDIVNNNLGGFIVKNAGYLDVIHFLDIARNYFASTNSYVKLELDYSKLTVNETVIINDSYSADKIIFCEGFAGKYNPYFGYLPFQFSKGELLDVEIKNLERDTIVNGGVFILPHKNGRFKVGSTYFWDDETTLPTERGRSDLAEKLSAMLKTPYEVKNHVAGIRPTVNDRRPFLGFHKNNAKLGIFNGLGTKGVMLAPYFAKHFCEHIKNNTKLLKEVDICRYDKYLTKS